MSSQENPFRLLMTGATGMVGACVLARLMAAISRQGQNTVSSCAVIVRDKGKQSGEQRIETILSRFEEAWQTQLPRPMIFSGDLNEPLLGLSTENRQWIETNCDSILHSAASLNFAPAVESPTGEPFRTNVGGTRNVVQLAEDCSLQHFHHVSTAYVCGLQQGRVLESNIDVGQSFSNDYEDSKVQAEQLVRTQWLGGISSQRTLTVYRPSIVIDPIGLTPVSGDRTIYGAFSMYQMLASRFGLPGPGEWFRNLGFDGSERKNLIDVHWIAQAIETAIEEPTFYGKTYHLTADGGTSIDALDQAFRESTQDFLASRRPSKRKTTNAAKPSAQDAEAAINEIAAPFVKTFLPYFKDDPEFDRTNIDSLVTGSQLPPPPVIDTKQLLQMTKNWSPMASKQPKRIPAPNPLRSSSQNVATSPPPKSTMKESTPTHRDPNDDVVLCGYEVRLPGGVDNAQQFEDLLYRGQSAIDVLPADRLDRKLYLHPKVGTPGKTYTEIGGCVDPTPVSDDVQRRIAALGDFDLTHTQFAQVAAAALRSTVGCMDLDEFKRIDPLRAGIFVGHSGGTESGGALALATLAESAARFVDETANAEIDASVRDHVRGELVTAIRRDRPQRHQDGGPELNAYAAASLTARLLSLRGRREVIDAACSSSLIALHHAATAIGNGKLDFAVVGGATYNNVDNLALFSQTGACSASGSYPFDSRASGLVSSEGYVAVTVARRSVAEKAALPILATLCGVGISSDGKGKGLWAPRSEGQQLAMRRATDDRDPLDIDYLECHATSTQVGDATELESLDSLLKQSRRGELPIGSVKSNLGHLLEAAGLVGLVKCLIAMQRGELAPSINFETPTPSFDWEQANLRVVDTRQPWPETPSNPNQPRIAAVNAFGIGGLNAHAVFEQELPASNRPRIRVTSDKRSGQPTLQETIAIVGRGLVLPGAANAEQFADLLRSGESRLENPPSDRWPTEILSPSRLIGLGTARAIQYGARFVVPHAMGGYVRDFKFDAQSYRIPPKIVANANPAQLMLIEAVRQSIEELDGGRWSIDRQRTAVTIGTMFGGQFSNELQIGLRLPELMRHIEQAAKRVGVPVEQCEQWTELYRKRVLEAYPALLDETGGFTASTLASRIARTFDLMGGACAVDADEASSGLALMTASEQLASGEVDTVICGTAQRSMDLVALEQLYRTGRLAPTASLEELNRDASKIFPAEGVAIMVLQRLSDAKRDGRKVLGTIDHMEETFVEDVAASRRQFALASDRVSRFSSSQIVRQIGHLGGGHGLVQAIAATLVPADEQNGSQVPIVETASDGYQIKYAVGVGAPSDRQQPINVIRSSQATEVNMTSVTHSSSSMLSVCLSDHDVAGLSKQLRQVAAGDEIVSPNSMIGECIAIIVARDSSEIRAAAQSLLDGPIASGQSGTAPKFAAIAKLNDVHGDRIAWTFPGQGSQYSAVPRRFELDSLCEQSIGRFDAELSALNLESVGSRLHDPDGRLGNEVWWTQSWLLAVGTALTDSLLRSGLRPDVVLGHSFGECTAAWAAGVMPLRSAIEFAKQRSDAVTMHGGQRGELLSVRGEPSQVSAVLNRGKIDCQITHHNSPVQTVIAGSPQSISQAKKCLSDSGLASVVISVPAAFHTPAMAAARDVLAARQMATNLRPPRFAFLSATQNKYLAEPRDIQHNLIEQLVQPVGFSGAIERLIADGCGLLVEVGPGNVLTRLASATAGSRAICISADDPNIDIACSRRLVELASECFSGVTNTTVDHGTSNAPVAVARPSVNPPSEPAKRFEVVDVTRRSRRTSTHESSAVSSDPANNGHVKPHVSGQSVAAPVSAPIATKLSPAATPGNQDPGNEAAKSFLFDLVVDLTGYEPEIIDFDADLEAELGVDSIKKAQLIGELVQWAGLELTTQDVKLGEFQSMSDILGLIPSSETPTDVTKTIADLVDEATREADDPADVDPVALQRLMIDLLVDQTGYDEDIIDMEADLESELGVDSIKRAQLLGELEQQFELPPIQQSDLKLADFPTLASIHGFIMDQVQGRKKKSPLSLAASSSAEAFVEHPRIVRNVPANGTHRFSLRLRPAPRLAGMPVKPTFHGGALVVGDNPIAVALAAQLEHDGVPVHRLSGVRFEQVDQDLDAIWSDGATPHLFMTTCHDADALWSVQDPDRFSVRRDQALRVPYRICQRWMQRMIDDGIMDRTSLVTVVRGGGSFGLSSEAADSKRISNESGGMAGLTKAMLIEAWMRGHQATPMLVVDVLKDASPTNVVDGIYRELAVPSYDEEVVVSGENRMTVAGTYAPLDDWSIEEVPSQTRYPLTRGGTWVVAGGGRGITAMTAMELAQRHGLKLHLLGMAPSPNIDEATREHARRDRADLRRVTMRRVQAAGENPVKHWRQIEKAIEIDLTLDACRRRGIVAQYHSVNVSDENAVAKTLANIRSVDGPIRGVIQGAGSGQDARFDRKRPEKVDQCLSAKIDGTVSLAGATAKDPLEWFIGFGSISGRFGANGHTDYSAANDMLAKLVADLGRRRPETRCVTFHWHAWGDVGMATKPEAKLALDMIGMKFMPASEGLAHFLGELECGGDVSEVLITDRRYVRKFFPLGEDEKPFAAPLLLPAKRESEIDSETSFDAFSVTLEPTVDLFLREHLVASKPTLPMVIATELMAQAAKVSELSRGNANGKLVGINGLRAHTPLKASSDDAFAIEVIRDESVANGWTLACDLRRRDGRLVEARRKHFSATMTFGELTDVPKLGPTVHLKSMDIPQQPVTYLNEDAAVYHGPSLRCLKTIGFATDPASKNIPIAIGTIVAPSPAHLAGEERPLTGWLTSPATMDAVLYACGILAGQVGMRASLPISIDQIALGRLPQPGEPLRVVAKWLSVMPDGSGGILTATLIGQNNDLIAELTGYRVGWL